MNMLGIITPIESEIEIRRKTRVEKLRDWLVAKRVFLTVVVLPTLLVAGYLFLISSDQYESEAHFLVRRTNVETVPGTGMSQALSMVTGASAAQNEAMSVADYLTSHDVVATLRHDSQLVERFHRSDVDPISRLRQADPAPETLLKYYRKQVLINYNTETGITTLKVRSFRPTDSFAIARKLLELGEHRVNLLNVRGYTDAVAMSRQQLAEAETELERAQQRITRFRQSRSDINPEASGQAQIGLVTTLTGQLASARAQLSGMRQMISPSSPQYQAVAARVGALEAQVAAQSGRLTGGSRSIAAGLSGYDDLQLRQQFLAKRYEAAAASLDKARDQALRQQLYVVRVVDANMPVKSTYPERGRILLTLVLALLLAYSIGWLIVAGVREHSA